MSKWGDGERERERQKHRQTDRQTDRQRQTDRRGGGGGGDTEEEDPEPNYRFLLCGSVLHESLCTCKVIGSAVSLSAAAVTEFSHHARQHSQIDNADDHSHQRLIPVKPPEIRMQVAAAYSLREVPFATVKSVAKRRNICRVIHARRKESGSLSIHSGTNSTWMTWRALVRLFRKTLNNY